MIIIIIIIILVILHPTLPREPILFGRWLAPRSGNYDDEHDGSGGAHVQVRWKTGEVEGKGAKRGGGGHGGVLLAPTATDRLPAAARLGHTVAADVDDAPRRFSVVALYSRRTLCCLVYGTTTAATADANGARHAINDDGLSVRRGPLLRRDRIGGRHRVIAGRRRAGGDAAAVDIQICACTGTRRVGSAGSPVSRRLWLPQRHEKRARSLLAVATRRLQVRPACEL